MLVSVVFMGLEAASKGQEHQNINGSGVYDQRVADALESSGLSSSMSGAERTKNNLISLGFGVLVPVFITIKCYFIRKYAEGYKSVDMGIDALIFEKLCYCLLYVGYVRDHGFDVKQFVYGTIVGVLYLLGKLFACIAYDEGPGGPVNTIMMTQSLYQFVLTLTIDHQTVGRNGVIGFVLGLVATVIVSLGNMFIKKCIKKERYDKSPLRRFL
jgi:hypothetical protein